MPETRKRPQRAAALKQTSYKVDEPLSEAEAGTSEAESVRSQLQRAKVRPPRKKAKLTATNAPAVSEGSTRRRKSLSKFLDMPLDVLYEIFGFLHPKDILSLSRTTHLFRDTLSAPNACGVWRVAMDRDDAPACPSDWTEPRWAALLYDRNCQSCLTKNIQHVDYRVRRRLCTRCRKEVILSERNVRRRIWTYRDTRQIMDLSPMTTQPPSGWSRTRMFWHLRDLQATDRNLERFKTDKKALDTWIKGQANLLEEIEELATQCAHWISNKTQQRRTDDREVTEKRFHDIAERLKDLGYSSDDVEAVRRKAEVRRSTPLTDRSWNMIKKGVIASLDANREKKRLEALQRRYVERRVIVHGFYSAYKSQRIPLECRLFPYTVELCSVPELKKRIEAGMEIEATTEAFSDVAKRLPALVLSFQELLRQEAQSTLQAQPSRQSTEPVDLNLATSVLQCIRCSGLMFGWSELQEHHCIAKALGLFYSVYQLEIPAYGQNAKFCCPPESLTHQVIRLSGLDPATATIADMDAVDMSYFCPPCLDHFVPVDLKYYYTWRSIIHHCLADVKMCRDYGIATANTCVLDHLRVIRADSQSTSKSFIWHCNHCPVETSPVMFWRGCVEHISTKHGIQDPTIGVDMFTLNPTLRHNSDHLTVTRNLIAQ